MQDNCVSTQGGYFADPLRWESSGNLSKNCSLIPLPGKICFCVRFGKKLAKHASYGEMVGLRSLLKGCKPLFWSFRDNKHTTFDVFLHILDKQNGVSWLGFWGSVTRQMSSFILKPPFVYKSHRPDLSGENRIYPAKGGHTTRTEINLAKTLNFAIGQHQNMI